MYISLLSTKWKDSYQSFETTSNSGVDLKGKRKSEKVSPFVPSWYIFMNDIVVEH